MVAYTGLGCLPIVLLGALMGIWFAITDARDGDWATACLAAVAITLAFGLVNLMAALSLNRARTPGRLPGRGATVWTPRHRTGGTPLQCFSPHFLAVAGLFGAGWTLQWVHWSVAAAGYGALTVLYHGVPGLARRPARAAAVGERGRYARAHGWAFRERLPSLARRWTLDPLQPVAMDEAALMNVPSRAVLRDPFAVMSGTHEGVSFTVADGFVSEPFAPFRAWQQHHVTVCAVHLTIGLPFVRVALPDRDVPHSRHTVEVETLRPDFAEALVTEETIEAMLAAELTEWSIQGRDVFTVLREQPADHDLEVVHAIEQLTALVAALPADLAPWADGTAPDLPLRP
ncbi:hypothetical protein BU52_18715 [Streptomyces toyocaensis]|uniref:Uncharacterized protein n=1 Tax=Streptomyces toyocaensis TaxID=55952 RepID=A0A081XPT6_STRTO|nr:hypothetical protein [Streptomyces toyocaensis]KES05559.1 hypothetical protein BU52_18715 [Streptomyces toyocaensis]